jgi:hypothetical protein
MKFPSIAKSRDRLRRAGWVVGETRDGPIWVVTGTKGENLVNASGTCRVEVWWRACFQARELGTLVTPAGHESSPLLECWSCGRPILEEILNCPHCGRREGDLSEQLHGFAWWQAGLGLLILLGLVFVISWCLL